MLRAFRAEIVKLTSCLEEEPAPVQAPARPKGKKKLTKSEIAIMKRDKRIQR